MRAEERRKWEWSGGREEEVEMKEGVVQRERRGFVWRKGRV